MNNLSNTTETSIVFTWSHNPYLNQTVYAKGTLSLNMQTQIGNLFFTSQFERFEDSPIEKIEKHEHPSPDEVEIGYSSSIKLSNAHKKVAVVLVNMSLPPNVVSTKKESTAIAATALWLGLAHGVAAFCREVFQNMNPTHSTLLIQSGDEHFAWDRLFLDSSERIPYPVLPEESILEQSLILARSYSPHLDQTVYAKISIPKQITDTVLAILVECRKESYSDCPLDEPIKDTNKPTDTVTIGYWGESYLSKFNQVEALLINVSFPSEVAGGQAINSLWLGLVHSIAGYCQQAFPKFKKENSAIIIHRGDEHYHWDFYSHKAIENQQEEKEKAKK